jgi:hypothetical protein
VCRVVAVATLQHVVPSHPIPSIHPTRFPFLFRYCYQMINTITKSAALPSFVQTCRQTGTYQPTLHPSIKPTTTTTTPPTPHSSSSLPPLSDAAALLLLSVLALALTLPLPLPLAPPPALALKVNFSLVEACWALLAEGRGVPTLEAFAVEV